MKKIAPLFFILAVALSLWICVEIARHPAVTAPPPTSEQFVTSAQKGPLRLTLTLYSNRVPRGGPLWFRLGVANIGKKSFTISDPVFASRFLDDGDNFIDYLSVNGDQKGFHLIVLDEKGKEVDQSYQGTGLIIDVDPCLGGYDWNWSWSKIQRASDSFKKRQLDVDNFKALWNHSVDPGKSIETIAWSYHGLCNGQRAHPPTPPGRFAELYGLDLSKPGHYRIYAGLNHVPTQKEIEEQKKVDRDSLEVDREHGWKSDWYGRKYVETPEDAVIRTPAISFEVLP
jgi:hypothetical protein